MSGQNNVAAIATTTHAELTEVATRPPGTPPSQCPGTIEFAGGFFDAAQEGEGPAGESVPVEFCRCRRCGSTIVVSHGPQGWRIRNQIDRPDPAEEAREAC